MLLERKGDYREMSDLERFGLICDEWLEAEDDTSGEEDNRDSDF